jgi:hypothetical protein
MPDIPAPTTATSRISSSSAPELPLRLSNEVEAKLADEFPKATAPTVTTTLPIKARRDMPSRLTVFIMRDG